MQPLLVECLGLKAYVGRDIPILSQRWNLSLEGFTLSFISVCITLLAKVSYLS